MDLPLDAVFEVSLHVNLNMSSKCGGLNVASIYHCHVSRLKGSPAIFPALEAI
jgi:hypothetical protein